jgi:protein TonB
MMRSARRVAEHVLFWGLAALIAGGSHAATIWHFAKSNSEEVAGPPPAAFVIELAPLPVARADIPVALPPGPDQVEASAAPPGDIKPEAEQDRKIDEPKPEKDQQEVELPPAPEHEQVEVPLPAPKAEPEKSPPPAPPVQAAASATTATQAVSDQIGEKAAAPQNAAPNQTASESTQSWAGRLSLALEKAKRYPTSSRTRREQGTVQVQFTIDRSGKILSSRVLKSSGHSDLDAEALAILQRAQPLPAPPVNMPGNEVALTLPIQFRIR